MGLTIIIDGPGAVYSLCVCALVIVILWAGYYISARIARFKRIMRK